MHRAVVLARGSADHDDATCPLHLGPAQGRGAATHRPAFVDRVAEFERGAHRRCARAGRRRADPRRRALLGMSERHLRYKLKKYGLVTGAPPNDQPVERFDGFVEPPPRRPPARTHRDRVRVPGLLQRFLPQRGLAACLARPLPSAMAAGGNGAAGRQQEATMKRLMILTLGAMVAYAAPPAPRPTPPGKSTRRPGPVGPNFVDNDGDGICDRYQAGDRTRAGKGARRGGHGPARQRQPARPATAAATAPAPVPAPETATARVPGARAAADVASSPPL